MKLIVSFVLSAAALLAQGSDIFLGAGVLLFQQHERGGARDFPITSVGRMRMPTEGYGTPGHPYHIEARHPDGTVFYTYDGWNLRTTAGTNWQSDIMSSTSTPSVNAQCNYLALTNTAVTPAEADTTLSGEIATNGLARAQGTYTNASTTVSVPGNPTVTIVGTTGAVSYWYWIDACNQGICTTLTSAGTTTTANATLSTTNYAKITFTGVNGAAAYRVWRTTSSSAPTGTVTNLVSSPINGGVFCDSSLSCTAYDFSNTLASGTVAASNVTNFGKLTLVHTWTATAAQSAQAFGVFTAVSSGTMCFEGTFTAVSLNTNDTFQLTETVYF